MVQNVSFKRAELHNSALKTDKQIQTSPFALKKDVITFTQTQQQALVSQKEIKERIKNFKKIMGDQPIPKEVMAVLNDSKIPMALPVIDEKSAGAGTVRRGLKSAIEKLLPKSVSRKLVKKISPKMETEISKVAIRLDKLKILDKSEGIFRGNGEVFFISLVNDGATEPNLLRVETFKNIKDGDDLFDKGLQKPFTVYLSEEGKVPRLIDFRMMVMEADQAESKKASDVIDAITQDGDYKKIIEAIRVLIKNAAPPAAIFTLADTAIGVIKRVLKINEDDQLLYYAARFTKDFDNLGVGKYDNKYDKVELGYEILAK
jgi:hypothetical protein